MAKASGFITLMTDFGLADGFVGMMKGVIYNVNPRATIIDISHDISSQDISEAAFLLGASYRYFPKGSVHVVVVDPGVGSQRRAVAVETEDYYFVAPDNGVLTWALAQEKSVKSVELTNSAYFLDEISDTFHGRDIFAPVAAHLSSGVGINDLGVEIDSLIEISRFEPEVAQSGIKGHIIHVDRFGNLITDVPRRLFRTVVSDHQFSIELAGIRLREISRSYRDVTAGEALAIFNSFGNLEIAVNQGNAANVLRVQKGSDVWIAISSL